MQSGQLAKVLDPFYTDQKLGAMGPSDLGDVNLSHTLCTRSQQNLPHEVTGFPPGGAPGLRGILPPPRSAEPVPLWTVPMH